MQFKEYITEYTDVANSLDDPLLEEGVMAAINLLSKAFRDGKKMLVAGNGGSAADAQHFAAEFMGRFKKERLAYPAIALTTDTSFLTAWSNDYDYKDVFARSLVGLGNSGDVFVSFSTSGNSENIIRAFPVAKEKKLVSIVFLGQGGGKMKGMADVEIIVPSKNTPRIQEVHTFLLHVIAEEVEARMTAGN